MAPERRRRHLSPDTLLDLLEGRLAPVRRRAAEAHLGAPCSDCRGRLHALAELTGTMREDALEPVPESLHRRAIEVFAPPAAPAGGAVADILRTLVLAFDSRLHPLPAGLRRSVGEARRLRFELPGARLELEHESESTEQCVLRGRIDVESPELYRIEAQVAGEHPRRWADASGSFVFEGLPRGECRVIVSGPDGRYETPAFET